MALAFAPYNRELSIKAIHADEKTMRHLCNLGLTVGGKLVCMYESNGNVIIKVLETRLAINRALALKIQVSA